MSWVPVSVQVGFTPPKVQLLEPRVRVPGKLPLKETVSELDIKSTVEADRISVAAADKMARCKIRMMELSYEFPFILQDLA
jgi:hypothetical protein